MAGTRGPIPKRSDQRRRANKPEMPIDKTPGAAKVEVPAPDPDWHPTALAWYRSLALSGQSAFYEPSDWATAVVVAEAMSRDLSPQFVGLNVETGEVMLARKPMPGANLSAYLKAMAVLMATEGDRRRLRVELQRGKQILPDTPGVPKLDDYRDRTG